MSTDNRYNGWTNYETWAVKLWLDNDQGSQEFCDEQARECLQRAIDDDETDVRAEAVTALADSLESLHQENTPTVTGVYADLLGASLSSVNWREIAHACIDEIELYSAGWNMPGYMPESTPAVFLDADDALEHVKDAARDYLESLDDASAQESGDEKIDAWESNSAGEFGNTFGNYHYFVAKI